MESWKIIKICIEGKEEFCVRKVRYLIPKERKHHFFFFPFKKAGESSGQWFWEGLFKLLGFIYFFCKPLGEEVLKLMKEQKRILRRSESCHHWVTRSSLGFYSLSLYSSQIQIQATGYVKKTSKDGRLPNQADALPLAFHFHYGFLWKFSKFINSWLSLVSLSWPKKN